MTTALNRYLVAIIPPANTADQLQQWKEYFRDEYKSKASLNSPPHITLHMPFDWKAAKENELMSSLNNFFAKRKTLQIALNGFNHFDKRVIFAAVEPNEELTTMQSELMRHSKLELNLFNANYRDQAFHAHITLAFRDLKPAQFDRAWNEFGSKPLAATFECKSSWLLRHDGKVWQTLHEMMMDGE